MDTQDKPDLLAPCFAALRSELAGLDTPRCVEKELMQPDNIFVMDWASREYIRRPLVGLVDSERKAFLFLLPTAQQERHYRTPVG